MSDYKTIHGVGIRDYTTDPDTLITGQVWFDKTNKVLQFQATGAGAWATGGNLNTGGRYGSGAGIQTAALYFGGLRQSLSGDRVETESYNGSSWTEVNDMNTGRSMYAGGGSGSYTAALAATGLQNGPDSNLDVVELYLTIPTLGFGLCAVVPLFTFKEPVPVNSEFSPATESSPATVTSSLKTTAELYVTKLL